MKPKKDYDKTLEAVKKDSPEEWQLNDVFERLKKQGWQILRPNTAVTLEY